MQTNDRDQSDVAHCIGLHPSQSEDCPNNCTSNFVGLHFDIDLNIESMVDNSEALDAPGIIMWGYKVWRCCSCGDAGMACNSTDICPCGHLDVRDAQYPKADSVQTTITCFLLLAGGNFEYWRMGR